MSAQAGQRNTAKKAPPSYAATMAQLRETISSLVKEKTEAWKQESGMAEIELNPETAKDFKVVTAMEKMLESMGGSSYGESARNFIGCLFEAATGRKLPMQVGPIGVTPGVAVFRNGGVQIITHQANHDRATTRAATPEEIEQHISKMSDANMVEHYRLVEPPQK